MIKRFKSMALVLACLLGALHANAEFKDIKIDLTNGNYLTAEEMPAQNQPSLSIGFTVGSDGSVSRVDATDASAAIVLNGKFHSTQHGWQNFSSTVKVDGPVKITFGCCAWGGDVTVKNAASETVATFNTKVGCWNNKTPEENIASTLYKGDATTLTISGGSYVPYIAVEAIDPSEIVDDATVSFDLGEYAGAGQAPAAEKVEIGKTFTIPANYTIYQEGKTLVGWTDGARNYEIGEIVTVSGDMTLTPRFVTNTVSLADRTEDLTIKWNFRRDQGAPTVAWEGKTGVFMVAQAKIGTEIIDVKLPISTLPGKFNTSHNDWVQTNKGTTFTVPACNGAIVSFESYGMVNSKTPATTIDGQTLPSTKTPSFTIAGNSESVDIVAGDDISYLRYVQVVLPVVKSTGGQTFNNVEGSLTWTVGNEASPTIADTVNGAVSTAGVSTGSGLKVETATYFDHEMMKYTPTASNAGNVAAVMIEYRVKAAKGLTFNPSSISYNAVKVGTNNATFSYSYVLDGVESKITTVDAQTVLRNDNSNAATAQLGHNVSVSGKEVSEFAFRFYISNTANNKNIALSDIVINGVFNGTTEEVEHYVLGAKVSPEGAAELTVYPMAADYEAGSEISLSVKPNFGYRFINWTDANGTEVSKETKFTYTLNSNADLTANFKSVATYELKYNVDGGANSYMVQPSPAPTVVDGKNMYETGTKVTLTATSNNILSFNNWSDGTTFPEVSMTMDSDKELTAVYSASDYIIGWDFYLPGNNGRAADFSSTPENKSTGLTLYNPETETTSGWLDKSTQGAGGYESLTGAAVNWTKGSSNGDVGNYYFQTTKINARDFSNIKVDADLLFNYNAYTHIILEYSFDGKTDWKKVSDVTMDKAKAVYHIGGTLPAEADHAESIYLRWRPDLTSEIKGTASANDGTAIANIYITADAAIYDDGTAPVVESTIPENGAEGASATGKIVINFDEKVKLTDNAKATLNGEDIELSVSGKTVSASYRNLDYNSEQTFVLAANSVCDPAGNTLTSAVTVKFTTMSRPTVDKAVYHHEVSTVDEFLAALETANTRSNKGERYRIFLHNGTYDLGTRCLTSISADNISIVGQSQDGVVIVNHPEVEGIGVTATLFNSSTGLYLQNLTLKNAYDYTGTTGRAVCLQDKGDKTIAKNVTLLSYQDTYYSNRNTSRFYWEDSEIHGTVDFLCGGGDVYYNRVNLVLEKREGNCIAAPNGQLKYGYVFLDCEINAAKGGESDVDSKYTLGRPWGANARAQYINTRMNVIPTSGGWAEMGSNKPLVFAEYNSVNKDGIAIDLSGRKTKFDGGTQASAILTKAQVDELSIENVMGGSDSWNPLAHTEQAPAPTNVAIDEHNIITWDASDYALCWAVAKDGKVIAFVTEPTYTIEATAVARAEAPVYTVRAANEMGGLGEEVIAEFKESTGISDITADGEVVSTVYYNIQGIAVSPNTTGLLIKVETLATGETRTSKVIVK